MTYIFYLHLDEFTDATTRCYRQDPTIDLHLQTLIEPIRQHNIDLGVRSIIVAAFMERAGTVHVARCGVEEASTAAYDDAHSRTISTAVQDRARAVSGHLANAIIAQNEAALGHGRHMIMRPGLLLVPGLLDDLKRLGSDQTLWTWEEADPRDPLKRKIVLNPGAPRDERKS